MNNSTGFGFNELQAKIVAARLERCLVQIQEAIDFVQNNCSTMTTKEFNHAVGKVIVEIGLDILEDRIYSYFPHLRPRSPQRERPAPVESSPSGAEKTLDWSAAPLLELLIEALYRGETKFIPNLVAYEPLPIDAINAELERRSNASRPKSVELWCAWYLSSNNLSSEEWQILSAIIESKKRLDAAFREHPED